VEESEIPAYILDQIRGRGDLIYNKINPDNMKEYDE
jgi:hypothetical protein